MLFAKPITIGEWDEEIPPGYDEPQPEWLQNCNSREGLDDHEVMMDLS
jgi:hypothetical protein